MNRFLNIGELADRRRSIISTTDFRILPEPTVRQYDRNGYSSGPDVQYVALEAAPAAQAIRREIVRQEKHTEVASFKRDSDRLSESTRRPEKFGWPSATRCCISTKTAIRRASYQIYTPEGARLEANTHFDRT